MNVSEFMAGTHGPPFPAVILFCPGTARGARGNTYEPFLAEQAARQIVEAAVDPAARDLTLASYYADETEAGQVVLEAQTLPFLAERRVVVVRGAEHYLNETAKSPLLHYLAAPNDSTVLILIASKMDKRTKFYKACGKSGEIVECPELSKGEAPRWIKAKAKDLGKTIDGAATAELVQRAGLHLSDLNNALTLTAEYIGEEQLRITEQHVIEACADVAEEEIWALTRALEASEPGAALRAVRRLLRLGKHPDPILGTINWLLKSAYLVATAEGTPPLSPNVVRNVTPLARKLGVVKLRAAFALCTDAQFAMRSTGTDSELTLELLAIKLAVPRRRVD